MDQKKKMVRCLFWPSCMNKERCEYHHPTELCRNFPNCSFGDKCLNIHPASSVKCKFGNYCKNLSCTFQHPSGAIRRSSSRAARHQVTHFHKKQMQSPQSTLCKDYPDCVNENCSYLHPRYGHRYHECLLQ